MEQKTKTCMEVFSGGVDSNLLKTWFPGVSQANNWTYEMNQMYTYEYIKHLLKNNLTRIAEIYGEESSGSVEWRLCKFWSLGVSRVGKVTMDNLVIFFKQITKKIFSNFLFKLFR